MPISKAGFKTEKSNNDFKSNLESHMEIREGKLPQTTSPNKGRSYWALFLIGVGLTALLGIAAIFLAPLPIFSVMGSLTVALLLGLAWRSIAGLPQNRVAGVQFSAKKLLRYGIILTGVRLNFNLIVESGLQVLFLDLMLIVFGVTFIPWLGRKLGLPAGLSLLLAVGQSICGASAVGAVVPLTPGVKEDDVSLAVAICGLLGTVGVLFFSFSSSIFGLHGTFYGLLSGSTLHEIAQVVAAGPAGGPGAADLGMVVKLTRVMLLAPVALTLAFIFTLKAGENAQGSSNRSFDWKKLPIPWFIFGFLAVGAINSLGFLSKDVANITLQLSIFLMVMAMAAMGLMVDLKVIRKTGLKALGVSTIAFTLFLIISFLLIHFLGMS